MNKLGTLVSVVALFTLLLGICGMRQGVNIFIRNLHYVSSENTELSARGPVNTALGLTCTELGIDDTIVESEEMFEAVATVVSVDKIDKLLIDNHHTVLKYDEKLFISGSYDTYLVCKEQIGCEINAYFKKKIYKSGREEINYYNLVCLE